MDEEKKLSKSFFMFMTLYALRFGNKRQLLQINIRKCNVEHINIQVAIFSRMQKDGTVKVCSHHPILSDPIVLDPIVGWK